MAGYFYGFRLASAQGATMEHFVVKGNRFAINILLAMASAYFLSPMTLLF